MGSRTILYTGKGGVGKTSVAAATALRCAAAGLRTVVLSTDPAHSLADVLGKPLGDEVTRVGTRLWAQQVSAADQLRGNWSGVSGWLSDVLVQRGVDRISAQELTVPPGLDELFSLLELKRHHLDGRFDVVVVDCAPSGETLRLLSFPEAARWWIEKVVPAQGQLLAAARPLARALLDVSLPDEEALGDVQRLLANLVTMHEILRDRERVSIRLVLNPDRVVIDEARRTFTYLNLYGFLTDAVVVNRVFPEEVGEYFQAWRTVQQGHLDEVRAAFGALPILSAPFMEREVVGTGMLRRLGDELFGQLDAAAILHDSPADELLIDADGATLVIPLPLAARGDVLLKQVDDRLIVGVGEHRRTVALPDALAGCRAADAQLVDGELRVRLQEPAPVTAGV